MSTVYVSAADAHAVATGPEPGELSRPNSSRMTKARSDSRKLVKQALPGFSGIVC